jgi:hypothetical protein
MFACKVALDLLASGREPEGRKQMKRLVWIGFIMIIAGRLLAAQGRDCTQVIDQDQELEGALAFACFYQADLAQSFIQSNENISGAGLKIFSGSGAITLELWDNLPNVEGAVMLASVSGTVPAAGWMDFFWDPISTATGQTYYFHFYGDTAVCISGSTGNPYPNGEAYALAGYHPFPNADFTFRTFYCVEGPDFTATPEPTTTPVIPTYTPISPTNTPIAPTSTATPPLPTFTSPGSPTHTPTPYVSTQTPISTNTPIPSNTPIPTITAAAPTATAMPPTQTPAPECTNTGCEVFMPSHDFTEGDECYCDVYVCNDSPDVLPDVPVFVILDAYGTYFFAPRFGEYSYYQMDIDPGRLTIQALPIFTWPAGTGSGSGLIWYAAMTDAEITQILGAYGSFSFGWH